MRQWTLPPNHAVKMSSPVKRTPLKGAFIRATIQIKHTDIERIKTLLKSTTKSTIMTKVLITGRTRGSPLRTSTVGISLAIVTPGTTTSSTKMTSNGVVVQTAAITPRGEALTTGARAIATATKARVTRIPRTITNGSRRTS